MHELCGRQSDVHGLCGKQSARVMTQPTQHTQVHAFLAPVTRSSKSEIKSPAGKHDAARPDAARPDSHRPPRSPSRLAVIAGGVRTHRASNNVGRASNKVGRLISLPGAQKNKGGAGSRADSSMSSHRLTPATPTPHNTVSISQAQSTITVSHRSELTDPNNVSLFAKQGGARAACDNRVLDAGLRYQYTLCTMNTC